MTMRPMDRTEAFQHLFVLAIAAFMIVAPFFMVEPEYAAWVVTGLGCLFAVVDLMVMAALRRPPQS